MSIAAASDAAADGFVPFRDDDSLLAFIGEIGVRRDDGAVCFEVRLKEGALNPLGILHGGALAALFDVAMYEVA